MRRLLHWQPLGNLMSIDCIASQTATGGKATQRQYNSCMDLGFQTFPKFQVGKTGVARLSVGMPCSYVSPSFPPSPFGIHITRAWHAVAAMFRVGENFAQVGTPG